MTDTIELLEAIGSDASLRYASADILNGVLEQTHASAELMTAVAAGNGASLRVELGIQQVPQTPQSPTQLPGQEPDEEEEEEAPQSERCHSDHPSSLSFQ
ncbi:hypothetical protein IHE49_01525 [Rhodanobacter sp. 7MK24]|uniref:hypothetical protein n=1 Tax=Rhodanobacter sp. 7MK24 TaxID=2775922 RepID=UPI00177D9442|nr:hypothetical protein [Rhodanobacter sp. 7MK24]MBD8879157.1 hypothetical protein [Rhodanobacter sp. 7MK24]